jgi:uncharacterized secreted repeat protein (TIGR03808 family)
MSIGLNRRGLIGSVAALPFLRLTAKANALKPGKGDQTVELQNAIDAAAAGYGHVQLAAGTFTTGALRIPKNITITGVPGATELRLTEGDNLLSLQGGGDIVLQGLAFSAKGTRTKLLIAEKVERLIIQDCDFAGGAAGIEVSSSAGRIVGSRFRFQKEVALQALESNGLEISGNTVTDQANNGIQVFRADKGDNVNIISNNFIARIAAENGSDGPYGNGINVYNSKGTIVANNRISDCAFTAIRNNASDESTITGNQITRCNETALYVEFVFLGAVVSNNTIDTASQGISIANFLEGGRMAQCTGNLLRNIAGKNAHNEPLGGAIAAEAETVVANNVIEKTEDFGLQLGWGPYARNLVANANVLKDCTKGILFSAVGPGPIQISNNVIAGSTKGSIVGMDHYTAVTPDLGVDAAQTPKHVTLANNIVKS